MRNTLNQKDRFFEYALLNSKNKEKFSKIEIYFIKKNFN